jgi:hypothetical protein
MHPVGLAVKRTYTRSPVTKTKNNIIVCRCLLFVAGTEGGLVLFYELQSTSRDEAIWAENTSLSTSLHFLTSSNLEGHETPACRYLASYFGACTFLFHNIMLSI